MLAYANFMVMRSVIYIFLFLCPLLNYSFPKDSVDIEFYSEGYTLRGKLIAPEDKNQRVPAIIFLIGSEESSSHTTNYKSFLNYFFENALDTSNVAVLHFDERGVGRSDGKWHNTTLGDRARDAKNAAEYLKTLPYIDPQKIFVAGHGQGGWIAQMSVSRYPLSFAGGISLAGPTFGVKKQLINEYYTENICKNELSEKEALSKAKRKAMLDLAKVTILPIKPQWRQLQLIKHYDPRQDLLNIQKPMLFVWAENDGLVNETWSRQEFENMFPAGLPRQFKTYTAPDANHELKIAPLCFEGNSEDLEYSPRAKKAITNWLQNNLF